MGRAGSGGGGRSSSGGHSSGRSGGGHSVSRSSSGGSRAGSGSRSSSRSFGGGAGAPRGSAPRGGPVGGGPWMPRGGPGMPPPPPRGMGPGMPPPPRRRRVYGGYRGGGCLTAAITMFVIIFVVGLVYQSMILRTAFLFNSNSSNSQSSTIVREKLDTGNSYINDCVIDELGWFDNVSKTESRLKDFWEETGVQPYIILRDYDASLTTDSAKEQWASDYYDENFDTENIFLFVYFAEEDTDNDVGYMAYANGYETSSVMDSEAVEIFWNNIDKYWYTDLSTDDLFVNVFNDTADTIMHVSTTGKDIFKWILIVIVVILIGAFIISLVKQKSQRAKEKAEEDQRILNTPINDIAKDDLENKYL